MLHALSAPTLKVCGATMHSSFVLMAVFVGPMSAKCKHSTVRTSSASAWLLLLLLAGPESTGLRLAATKQQEFKRR
jgi:hypothetical protein